MMLHSIVPPQMIFPSKESPYEYYRLCHGFAECTKKDGRTVLLRIDSTDPSDYLRSDYKIGSNFHFMQ